MTGTKKIFAHIAAVLLATAAMGSLASCIQPPLRLPAQDALLEFPIVQVDMEVVWNVDVDWKKNWYYGWDQDDEKLWGKIGYEEPTSFEVRRYYLGEEPSAPHTEEGRDGFTVEGNSFRKIYKFGYYDMLLWSNIYTPEEEQMVVIDESNLEEVVATTSVTHAIQLKGSESKANALYNQPEIFYSAYPRDIFISKYKKDYDYYDEVEHTWVKRIDCSLDPIVYIYLVQIILEKNDGRVKGVSGDVALSALTSVTSVNTGHTHDNPGIVYFNSRMKKHVDVDGQDCDIIGGKLTTYGLCDMEGFATYKGHTYQGSRTDLPNYLYYELIMSNEGTLEMKHDVTEQVRTQCHGGVITIRVDCTKLENPEGQGEGSIFRPVVDDYEELEYDIPL